MIRGGRSEEMWPGQETKKTIDLLWSDCGMLRTIYRRLEGQHLGGRDSIVVKRV